MSKEELLEKVRLYVGEDTSDAALELIEAVSEVPSDGEDWKAKYDELDKSWRKRYRERFFTGESEEAEEAEETEETEETEDYSYDKLFKEGE